MILFWASLPHVCFYCFPSLLPQSCGALCHWKQAEIILRNQEYVKPMEPQRQRDIAEDPLEHLWIRKVWGREYPVLCSDNLRKRLYTPIFDESWNNLCSSA
jgi:hypothetical protein